MKRDNRRKVYSNASGSNSSRILHSNHMEICSLKKCLAMSVLSLETESKEQDTSSRSGNDTHADDADIRPIYDEEPMAEERASDVAKTHHMIAPGSSSSELRIHDHNNEPCSSKLVLKVVPPADKTATSRQELELLFHHHITMLRSTYCNLDPNDKGECTHKYKQQCCSLISAEPDSSPHAYAQTTKTYYWHQY
uniref:Uncharacterized protein n=1 Tax=Tanacetum cinerariifolium TaxID=118510 RepID=A0A6L2J7C2_TANCI|nr:hypothetical protein [Tanacetum cinerariifolium]